jgi:hypothetical protein
MYSNLKDRIIPYMQRCEVDDEMRQTICQQLIRWTEQEQNGKFYVVVDRPDGSIRISEDKSKVYLVLGYMDSVAGLITKGGIPLPAQVTISLVPFKHYISYDCLLLPDLALRANKKKRVALQKELLGIYTCALDNGTVISSMPEFPLQEFPRLEELDSAAFNHLGKADKKGKKKTLPSSRQGRMLQTLSKIKKDSWK